MSLLAILERADRERWCTRWGCTTCAAHHFRRAVLDFIGHSDGLSPLAASALLDAVRGLDPDTFPIGVQYLLRWAGSELPEAEIQIRLQGTPVGHLYFRMLKARDAANASRAEAARRQSPEFVAQERARKAAERAARHEERLAAKRIRDAARRAAGELQSSRS